VLISVKPAFDFRNMLNCPLQGGTDSVDGRLLAGVDKCAHGIHLERDLDSQSPPERFSPYCKIETFRCRVQPSATPWHPEARIRNDSGQVLARVAPIRHNSQQC
jgi:hypothetical protein